MFYRINVSIFQETSLLETKCSVQFIFLFLSKNVHFTATKHDDF